MGQHWGKSQCPSIVVWINTSQYTRLLDYCTTMKKRKLLLYYDMAEPQRYSVGPKKPATKQFYVVRVHYDSIYIEFKNREN